MSISTIQNKFHYAIHGHTAAELIAKQIPIEVFFESDKQKKMRKRDPELNANWGTICTLVEMTAADGKRRQVQCANVEGLFRIIQSIPSPKADLELIFTMLGEASTTEIARNKNAQGFDENKKVSKAGGKIAGDARKALEKKSGRKVVSKQNYKELPEREVRRLKAGKEELW